MQVKLYTKNTEAEKQGKKRKGSQADPPKDQAHSAKMRNFLANYWTEKEIVEKFWIICVNRTVSSHFDFVFMRCSVFV